MAKAITITNLDEKCNQAINIKRAELLLQGKDFVKSEVVVAILHEWLQGKNKVPSYATNGTILING